MNTRFKNRAKEYLSIVGGFASVLGLILAVFIIAYTFFLPEKINITFLIGAVMALSAMIVAFAILNIFLVRQYDKLHQANSIIESLESEKKYEIKSKEKMADIAHNFAHEYRKIIHKIYSDLMVGYFDKFEKRKNALDNFHLFMLSNIKEIMDILTEDECAVCIKMLGEDGTTVTTLKRDHVSYRARSKTDIHLPKYPHYKNTAFKKIMDPDSRDTYYFCNNLKAEQASGNYDNENKEWNEYYNACLVAPIRIIMNKQDYLALSGTTEEIKDSDIFFNIIGFICVDNINGGFDTTSLNVLASFADSYYHLFNTFRYFNEAYQSKGVETEGEAIV